MPSFDESSAASVLLPVPLVPPSKMITQHCPSRTFELMSKSIRLWPRSKPHLHSAHRTSVLNFALLNTKLLSSPSNVMSLRAPARAKQRVTANIHATAASARDGFTPTSCRVLLSACWLNHCSGRWLVHSCSIVAGAEAGEAAGGSCVKLAGSTAARDTSRAVASSGSLSMWSSGKIEVASLALCHTASCPTTMRFWTEGASVCASERE